MEYINHIIRGRGHIEVYGKEDGEDMNIVISPNESVPKWCKKQIESDENFDKYRTKENAKGYEQLLIAEAPTLEEKLQQVENNRRNAYRNESDPLFLKWQRGEATEQEWLDKIAEIKERFPKPE